MLFFPFVVMVALLLGFALAAAYFALGQLLVGGVRRRRQPTRRPQRSSNSPP